ncbi:uncharacterized protein LOC122859797 [Aphidius gifuensis]|uniref:uncharacterized protein LOC122859797 n=1 Tax=Aphidius gifuensis TaxID=684658 RepID=UPI001CDBA1F3|nr:uncharacterized protein LOC122859797 [Aphidius gifuensis]
MTRKEFSSKHTIFDCQNNKLLKIKLPTWSGTYADKYQVYDLNGIKIADIYRKSENSCYASISYLGDIDVTRKALVLSATILLKYLERIDIEDEYGSSPKSAARKAILFQGE